ncbi:hypothetical protein [Streptomyces spongiae]|uniref:hypothetical protein n=1 Tax=Streptomyces spongiae TaxID=565072 RepID=UPI001883FC46|nr:hypothetical protein [Streptomyces spongiae]
MTWTWEYDPDEQHVAGEGPKGGFAHVSGGFFNYLIVPRHERLYIMQVTFL